MTIEARTCCTCKVQFNFDTKRSEYDERNPDKGHTHAGKYCSLECMGIGQRTRQKFNCANCQKDIWKIPGEIKRNLSGNFFCNQSCAAKFNNKNKSSGTRRSKLEQFIEMKIIQTFPNLEFHPNKIDTIGYELDFYFPKINFAIEINGIFHYKPIFGEEKLQRIQNIDLEKIKLCKNLHIDLFILKDESIKFSETFGNKAWEIIKSNLLSKISPMPG